MKKHLILLCSTACVFPTAAAFAQSTGTVDFEKDTIVVTGSRTKDVGGIEVPDTPKAKQVVTQEFIARSVPGQNVLDTINIVPGVSFQNNDAYGNSGGTLTVRGFDATRVSYTLDGVQLNDSGNYNIYSNFSIDPELIEQVNVTLGSTDVDSPTASAVGGTINQRTRNPGREFGGRLVGTLGQFDYRRFFALIDTGELTPWGTRAFVSASTSKYDNPYNNYGKLDRQQYNAKVYQPIGANGDFVSVAGRYNRDRNNFFGSLPLRLDANRTVGSGPLNRYPRNNDEREYDINYPCTVDVPQAGVADFPNYCGTEFDRRYNPSNSVSIRGNSRFSLTDKLVLTVDPSFQYTKANGGGVTTTVRSSDGSLSAGGREGFATVGGQPATGFIDGSYYFGRDLNGDGDILDRVTLSNPSQTRTRRYAVIANLRYEINDLHAVRVSFTHDYSNHRQTGQLGFLQADGEPDNVFPIDEPIEDANGNIVQKRDRQSYAILDQVAAEYIGRFGPLTVDVGARLPRFTRDLENFCFTTSAGGFVNCFAQDPQLNEQYGNAFPDFQGPQKRKLHYSKLLPNIGLIYDFTPRISAFASYSKGISVPSTDNLYNAFFFPANAPQAKPNPETTDTFDGGLRYRSSKVQAQLAGWYTRFNDRLASAFDPELNDTVYRNLGRVNKWGVDASIAYSPNNILTAYVFGSWNDSEIKGNVQTSRFLPAGETCDTIDPTTVDGFSNCAFTAGNRESGAPKYSYGASLTANAGPVQLGVTAKRTGERYFFDNNQPIFTGPLANPTKVYSATADAYWLVNLDARLNLGYFDKQLDKTYFQLNVYNLFDQFYVGGFGGGLSQSLSFPNYGSPPFVQVGAPRTISGTLNIGF